MRESRQTLTHFEKREKLARIRENYRTIAAANLDAITVVDATMPAPALADTIWRTIEPLLPPSATKTARQESAGV